MRIRLVALLVPWLAIALSACTSHERGQPVLAKLCRPMSTARPISLPLTSPAAGVLRIQIEQRGISTVAVLAERPKSTARSPIERFGVVTFAPLVRKGERLVLQIRSRDIAESTGEVCVSADLIRDAREIRGERAFAAAGRAVDAGDWRRAFDLYLAAARDLQDRLRVAQTRHALAELAYAKFDDYDASYVLAAWSLADFGAMAPGDLRSNLKMLQARTLLESQRETPVVRRERVFQLLDDAQALATHAKFGARELPRFDTLRGFMDFFTGRPTEASALFAKAATACEALRDWECYARARQNIAQIAEEARDYTVALNTYRDALHVLPPELQSELIADIWGNYGRVQARAGLLRQSEQSTRTSIRLYAAIANCDGVRMSTARLGTLLIQVGNVGEAHSQLARAASLECPQLLAAGAQESSDSAERIADSLARTSHPENDAACAHLPEVGKLTDSGKLAVFQALLGLSAMANLDNDDGAAERCLATARTYAAYPNMLRAQLRLENAEGATLLERGRAEAARQAFERGLAIADRARLPPNHENRSLAYIGLARSALQSKRPADARKYARQSLMMAGARADVSQVVNSLQLLARTFEGDTSGGQAISLLQIAANLIEQVPIGDLDAEQRATWLATQHDVFAELTRAFATSAGDDPVRAWQAFHVSERGRARSMRYAMNQAAADQAWHANDDDSKRYHALMQRIAYIAAEAKSSRTLPVDALGSLVQTESEPAPETELHDVLRQRLAALDATLVEYAEARDEMFAFVVDADHIRIVPLGSRRDIATASASLYEQLRNPEAAGSDIRRAAARVAERVLWPLTSDLTHRRVVFVPDDALHIVPFAALPWAAGTESPLTVERVEVSVMPSTLFITRARVARPARASTAHLELIGDPILQPAEWTRKCQASAARPVMTVNSLPRLPGSRDEITSIADLARRSMPGSRIGTHLECGATPRALRQAAADHPALLHIATHGYVDAYRPRLSALVLTPDTDSNTGAATVGLLEILQMKIDSRLVVLSACDTSRGRLLPGEGVLGPAQAFLQAGAESVLASSWRIPDADTALFMRAFYRHLLVEHLPAAAALRRAQLDSIRADNSHDWAAFTLYGWPDTSL
jgi:CHAT domain-containing protein/tetratricopeptide (TPR) repeat protein